MKTYINRRNYPFTIYAHMFKPIHVHVGKNILDEKIAEPYVKLGYLQAVEEQPDETITNIEPDIDNIDISKLTKVELIDMALNEGFSEDEVKGKTKRELIELLTNK